MPDDVAPGVEPQIPPVDPNPVPQPAPPPVSSPAPSTVPTVYESRFSSQEEAVSYAQGNGQGPLTVSSDGTITNQHGETMVYDSDGNLAPKPGSMPGSAPSPTPVVTPIPLPVGPVVNPTPPAAPPVAPTVTPTVYESRFATLPEAITYAQNNGQGQLTIASDGTITNRFGEVMVYDSDGNLAPKPGSMPGSTPVATPAPVTGRPVTNPTPVVYESRFATLSEAIAYAQNNGQGQLTIATDGTITNRFGEVMVYDSDGNLAPRPGSMPNTLPTAATPIATSPARGGTANAGASGSSTYVPLPEFGSAAYKALLLETGRSDLIGFNYAAHLAVKTEASLPNFDQYFNAASGSELVSLLGSVDVNRLMATASSAQVQQLVSKFASDPAFAHYLDAQTAVQMPTTGSAAYETLLRQTGRTDLTGFDYSAHVQAITQAEESIRKIGLGSEFNEAKIRYASTATTAAASPATDAAAASASTSEESLVIIGSDSNDVIVGTAGKDVLIAGMGNDELNGGSGVDHAVLNASASSARLSKAGENTWQITASDGVKQITEVERIHFDDENLALDLGIKESAGQTVLLIGAVFGANQINNENYVGIGLNLLDTGTSYAALTTLAVDAAGLSSPQQLVSTLWQNVVGRAGTVEELSPFVAMLSNGTQTHELVELAAETALNQSQVNLVGLTETGISYV